MLAGLGLAGVLRYRALHGGAHGLNALGLVQVVEVHVLALLAGWAGHHATHGASGIHGFLQAGIRARACLGCGVVVGTQHQQHIRALLVQSLGHGQQVTRIKGHSHGQARRLVQAGAGGVALSHQQRTGCLHLANQVKQAGLLGPANEKLVGAAFWLAGCNALHVPQLAIAVAPRNHQLFAGLVRAHAKGQNPFAAQVRGLGWVGHGGAIAIPIRLGLGSRALVFGCAAGSFCSRSLLGAGALCGLFGWAGAGGGLVLLGDDKPVRLGQTQQCANLDGAEVIKRGPDSAAFPGFVAGGSAAPSVEQVEAGFVGEMVFNGHAHALPFVARQGGRDEAQGGGDGVRAVLGVVVVHD